MGGFQHKMYRFLIPSCSMKRKYPKICSICRMDYLARTIESQFCSKSCATKKLASRPNNPFKIDGNKIREKSLQTRRLKGFKHLNGGNGTGLTETQIILMKELGEQWKMEFIVPTGNPTRGKTHLSGIP